MLDSILFSARAPFFDENSTLSIKRFSFSKYFQFLTLSSSFISDLNVVNKEVHKEQKLWLHNTVGI